MARISAGVMSNHRIIRKTAAIADWPSIKTAIGRLSWWLARKAVVRFHSCSKTESASIATLSQVIKQGSTVHADEAAHWDKLHELYLTKRINHEWAYSNEEACTNNAESFSHQPL
jgi:hypothetical protein